MLPHPQAGLSPKAPDRADGITVWTGCLVPQRTCPKVVGHAFSVSFLNWCGSGWGVLDFLRLRSFATPSARNPIHVSTSRP